MLFQEIISFLHKNSKEFKFKKFFLVVWLN